MEPFTRIRSTAIPLGRSNIDTDQIVPKQFLKRVQKTGFGQCLFHNWRYDSDGRAVPSFALNMPQYQNSQILICGENFGCGSSREHAVWALLDYGIRAVVAPSFGDIFYSNCFKNGLLPIRMASEDIRKLGDGELRVDLKSQCVTSDQSSIPFEIEEHNKTTLLEGLDEIARTLKLEDEITAYEKRTSVPSAV